VLIKLSCDADR